MLKTVIHLLVFLVD